MEHKATLRAMQPELSKSSLDAVLPSASSLRSSVGINIS
jgi:hypothetical protein